MNIVIRAGAAAAFLMIAGCATRYQPNGLTGGFQELKVSDNTYRITVQGNGYTSTNRAEEIALLRASDLTIQDGFERFIVVGGAGVSQQDAGSTPVVVNRIGNTLVASGGDSITKPSGTITVRLVAKSDPQYVNAMDAKLIGAQLRAKLS
jgi:hypothetical protein